MDRLPIVGEGECVANCGIAAEERNDVGGVCSFDGDFKIVCDWDGFETAGCPTGRGGEGRGENDILGDSSLRGDFAIA